jgi:LemA protein
MQIFLLIIVVLALIGVVMYNALIAKKNQVDNIFAGVDAVLKKRFDLIPNLVASLERYMEHEKSLFENVAALRTQAMQPHISEDQKSPWMESSLLRWDPLISRWKPILNSKPMKVSCNCNGH